MENLSIIIPFYNEEKRLKKSFKILNNFLLNRKNAEIIFVNDGSNDQSENIIHNFIYNFKKKNPLDILLIKKI